MVYLPGASGQLLGLPVGVAVIVGPGVPLQPISDVLTARTRQLTGTMPVPWQSNDGHSLSCFVPREMFTPVTNSLTSTELLSLQSPAQLWAPAGALASSKLSAPPARAKIPARRPVNRRGVIWSSSGCGTPGRVPLNQSHPNVGGLSTQFIQFGHRSEEGLKGGAFGPR